MYASASGEQYLPSNVGRDLVAQSDWEPEPEREALADMAIGVGALALIATALTVIGYHFGGPVPHLNFWRSFAPLLLLPVTILLGVVLAPGGLLPYRQTTAGRRAIVYFAVTGLFLFFLILAFLNVPTILLLSR